MTDGQIKTKRFASRSHGMEYTLTQLKEESQIMIKKLIPYFIGTSIFTTLFLFGQSFGADCIPSEIQYAIQGGKILQICDSPQDDSILFRIDATKDGTLTVTIPDEWVTYSIESDCILNYHDSTIPFVIVDGAEVDYEGSTSSPFSITIPFSAGTKDIEVIASMIPEAHVYIKNCKDSVNYLKTRVAWQFENGYWGDPLSENGFSGEKSWARWLTGMIHQKAVNPGSDDLGKTKQIEKLPRWFFMNSTGKWWTEGKISNEEFVDGVEYLIHNNIIRFESESDGEKFSIVFEMAKFDYRLGESIIITMRNIGTETLKTSSTPVGFSIYDENDKRICTWNGVNLQNGYFISGETLTVTIDDEEGCRDPGKGGLYKFESGLHKIKADHFYVFGLWVNYDGPVHEFRITS